MNGMNGMNGIRVLSLMNGKLGCRKVREDPQRMNVGAGRRGGCEDVNE